MKRNNNWLFIVLLMALSVFLLSSGNVIAAIDGGYVGSATCGTCHSSIKADFDQSGHPYKVRFTNGATPTVGSDPLSALLVGLTPLGVDVDTLTNGEDCSDGVVVCDGSLRLDWLAVEYVIGGYGWKARWGMKDTVNPCPGGSCVTGHVWTGVTQHNILSADLSLDPLGLRDDYSSYNANVDKLYSCAKCHNTNGTSSIDAGCITALGSGRSEPWASSTDVTAANPGGFRSEWTFSGVQCEACHGAGETHAANPTALNIIKDSSASACGTCHIRAKNTTGFGGECDGSDDAHILTGGAINKVEGGFSSHHEQYNEMVGYNGDGVHASLDCVDCHDPHMRTHTVTDAVAGALGITDNADSAEARGAIKASCDSCHPGHESAEVDDVTTAHAGAGVTCVDCHMAEQTKSATGITGSWGLMGDVKSHIVKINTTLTTNTRLNDDGKRISENYLTLAFACGKCHDTAIRPSADTDYDTKAEVVTGGLVAGKYHKSYTAPEAAALAIDGGYVGTDTCATCHVTKAADFAETGHPYKVRFTNGATPTVGSDPLSALLVGLTPLAAGIDTLTNGEFACGNGLIVCDVDDRLDWSAAEYVIGGWGWKARWGMKDTANLCPGAGCKTGHVWSGVTQHNILSADLALDPTDARPDYSSYNTNKDKLYSCAKCHNTNGTTSIDAGCITALGSGRSEPWASSSDVTATYPGGFRSEWTFSGVQCEACHGMGETHIVSKDAADITNDSDKDVCGKCHIRAKNTAGFGGECDGSDNAAILLNGSPATAGSFSSHHQQYNEMVGYNSDGVHASLDCVDCHDPHQRSHTVTDAVAGALGITDNALSAQARGAVATCESCHAGLEGGRALVHLNAGVACIDCHMAEQTKSATGESGTWGKMGDVRSHITKIDPTATANTRVNADGKTISTNYLTTAFACGKCHDSTMSSFVGIALQEADMGSYATGMHGAGTGSSPGATYARFNWYQGAGCYQVNFDGADNNSTCSWDFNGEGTSTDCVTSYTFSSEGTKSVTLTTGGGTRTMAIPAKAVNALPTTAMSVAVDSGDATGMTLEVTDGSSANGCTGVTIATSVVVWGDGTTTVAATSTGPFAHAYNVAGTYTISYSTRDSSGNKSFAANQTWTVPDLASSVCNVEGTITGITPNIGTKITLTENGNTVVKLGQTDTTGLYSIPNVQAGRTYTIVPSRNGWEFSDTTLGQTTISLSPLDCTPVTGNSKGNDFDAIGIW